MNESLVMDNERGKQPSPEWTRLALNHFERPHREHPQRFVKRYVIGV